jgi:ATP-dependent helicase/nuclease subunit A
MIGVVDAAARAAALDAGVSFCVSAPAGSGKTELLIQRYLCLLSRVKRPEQVLAITFTRKAAAEMRQRVMQALQSALAGEFCAGPHQLVTRELAQKALAADERGGWRVLQNLSRFNIKTIDSFCAGLTRQMPVLSQFGGQSRLLDDATPLYGEAVQELFKLLGEDHPVAGDLAALLLHFDNNWERLRQLLVSMLARREQWRGYLGVHFTPEESAAYLIASVAALVQDELNELQRLLAPYTVELLELLQFAAANLSLTAPVQFPSSCTGDLPDWRSVSNLLLSRAGGWRKVFTTREGFPAGKGEPQRRKDQLQAILTELRQIPDLQARLAAIRVLPEIEADSVSWQLVLHLSRLLPMLAAQLLLVFQRRGVVDHSQVAQSALLALGEDDAPTELALRLDYQIEHILVDEFQDTAITQYELLHKLTRGWGEFNAQYPDAPRTLMIVGDAMQSIYGFRGANVGLFLKARQEGFNGVLLQHLKLRCNFRSDERVVDWVNQTFMHAFPAQNDALRSQVRYSPAVAVRQSGHEQPVSIHAFEGEGAGTQEVDFICARIVDCVEAGRDTLAVLGRTRSHLQPIIKRLKQLKIPYYAPDLDSLARSPAVADLLTLCRALANDADRLAWMALLRTPWCGMQLADLLSVARCGEATPYTALWSILQSTELHNALSTDGRVRLQHIMPILRQASAKRDRLGLRVWVEQAWVALGGPPSVPAVEGLQDAEHFLQLLEQAEAEGVGLDTDWLAQQLQKRYMSAGNPDSKVHMMTLHKAKGLEFDRVIIPQLDRPPRNDGREILLWDEHSNARGGRSFFLAADDLSPAEAPTLYNYLKAQRQQKMLLEATRLLYVGATRAVSHLLLTASVRCDKKTGLPYEPARHSLLSSIWQPFAQQMTRHQSPAATEAVDPAPRARLLMRLSHSCAAPLANTGLNHVPQRTDRAVSRPDSHAERSIGRIVHVALKELSRRPVLPANTSAADQRRWRMELQREGLWGKVLDEALELVLGAIDQTLRSDHIGRWVLSSGHEDAHSEWALTTVNAQGTIKDIVIDRSFIDRATGWRWIIDYKNSVPVPGESLHEFAARETATCMDQLRQYCDAVRQLGQEPLCCALFFTSLGHLHTIPELQLLPAPGPTNPCNA